MTGRAALAAALAAAVVVAAPAGADRTPRSAGTRPLAHWAYLLGPAAARARPSATAPLVTTVRANTPEHRPNLVLVVGVRHDAYGRPWVRVRLSMLPNGSTGWLLRTAVGDLHAVRTRLVVDRAALTATLYRDGRAIFRAPVGVGQEQWPTPAGEHYVRERLPGLGDPVYGPVAFGLSARSAVLTDWPGGGHIGIHGTNQPELLPGRVSHGCIRLRNEDVLRLAALMPLGTVVAVR
jgi:lipoprotein-anchoring transpeptidase ErfK/SrfK